MATQKNKSVLLRLITKVKSIANQIKQINADITGLKSSGGTSPTKSWKIIYTPPTMGGTNIDKLTTLPLSAHGALLKIIYTSGIDNTHYEYLTTLNITLLSPGHNVWAVDSNTRLYVTDDLHIRFFEVNGVYDNTNNLSLWDMYEYDLAFDVDNSGTGGMTGTGTMTGTGIMGGTMTGTGAFPTSGMTVTPSKNTYNIVSVELYY